MKFYQKLQPFKAISFDLDDTLYSNREVMLATDTKLVAFFAKIFPEHAALDMNFWWPFRQQTLNKHPNFIHDVGALRRATYTLGFIQLGQTVEQAELLSQQAYDYFMKERSNFSVPENVHQLLKKLSNYYPLVAISNGNVDTHAIGLKDYFSFIYHAGDLTPKATSVLKRKPSSDMFALACKQLAISPQELLHVGDCGQADISGAILAGCQSVWLSCYNVGKPLSVLPHSEITDIIELNQLV